MASAAQHVERRVSHHLATEKGPHPLLPSLDPDSAPLGALAIGFAIHTFRLYGHPESFRAALIASAAADYGWVARPAEEPMVPAAVSVNNEFAQELFEPLPRRYDRLAEILSFGQNGRWRREMVGHIADGAPKRVLDVASGTAGVAINMAERTQAHITGVDLTEAMLRQGRANVGRRGMSPRIALVAGRGEQLPFPDTTFDALGFTYLLRYVDDPAATLRELARVVRPGGVVASLEFLAPPNPLWRIAWWLYTRLILPLGGLVLGGREWFEVGRFLGPNISGHYRRYPVTSIVDMWTAAGIEDVHCKVMSLGGGLVMWGRRRA